jgi:hypothetical protein
MTQPTSPPHTIGTLERQVDMTSRFVQLRNVDVWLPPGYDRTGGRRFPTIYAHDGQNLFEPGNAFGSLDWGVDGTLSRLIRQDEAGLALMIGIWNTEERWRERLHVSLRFLLRPTSPKPEPR